MLYTAEFIHHICWLYFFFCVAGRFTTLFGLIEIRIPTKHASVWNIVDVIKKTCRKMPDLAMGQAKKTVKLWQRKKNNTVTQNVTLAELYWMMPKQVRFSHWVSSFRRRHHTSKPTQLPWSNVVSAKKSNISFNNQNHYE